MCCPNVPLQSKMCPYTGHARQNVMLRMAAILHHVQCKTRSLAFTPCAVLSLVALPCLGSLSLGEVAWVVAVIALLRRTGPCWQAKKKLAESKQDCFLEPLRRAAFAAGPLFMAKFCFLLFVSSPYSRPICGRRSISRNGDQSPEINLDVGPEINLRGDGDQSRPHTEIDLHSMMRSILGHFMRSIFKIDLGPRLISETRE
jgi:hypothetical protein